MPYLHCPRCHRTAWLSTAPRSVTECRFCGTELDPMSAGDARVLTSAVRELRAARSTSGRFARDPGGTRRPAGGT